MSKSIFFQHPYELEKDERIQNLDKKMPDCGFGVFWKVYHRIRKAGTRYPVSGLMAKQLCLIDTSYAYERNKNQCNDQNASCAFVQSQR